MALLLVSYPISSDKKQSVGSWEIPCVYFSDFRATF